MAARAAVVVALSFLALFAVSGCGERPDPAAPSRGGQGTAARGPGESEFPKGLGPLDLPTSAPPDVLVLMLDTVRADRCSFVGYERPTTPHLEALARESVVFTDAWSPSSWTLPAHVALFTGRHPEPLGAVGPTQRPVPKDVPTLASLLAGRGFATGCFTGNPWIAEHDGLSRGFELVVRVYDDADGPTARAAHTRALQWMQARRRDRTPFFAFINDVETHIPRAPPETFEQRFLAQGTDPAIRNSARSLIHPRSALMGLGLEPTDPALLRAVSDLYDAELAHLDDEVGRLVRGMRDAGLLDGTLVVVLSDHGEGLGDHVWLEHGAFVHRELLRVPLLVRPPHGGPPRTVSDVVRVEDVFAEVLAQCGVALPPGATALPLLGDTSGRVALASERAPEIVGERMEEMRGPASAAILRTWRRSAYDGRFHLIVDDRGGLELFDVRDDPRETRNVAAAHPDIVAALRAKIAAVPPRPR